MRDVLDYSTPLEIWCEEDGPVFRTEIPEAWRGWRDVTTSEQHWASDNHRALNLERRQLFREELYEPCRGPCPYCRFPMDTVRHERRGDEARPEYREVVVTACAHCGYWDARDTYHWLKDNDSDGRAHQRMGDHIQWIRSQGRLRKFSPSDLAAPLDALRRHVERAPDDLRHIHPRTLERLVGSVFSDALDCEAVHVGGPGDNGIDLILLDAEEPIAIQVKRRGDPSKSEGVAVVRDFLGALLLEGRARGMVVTTAHQYSAAARSAADKARELGLVSGIELVNADALWSICKLHAPATPPFERAAPRLDDVVPPAWPRH